MSITDSGVQSAATALLDDLQSAGCTDGFDQYVADFQNAWNAANAGQPLVLSNGTPGADGLYGANTQAEKLARIFNQKTSRETARASFARNGGAEA